MNESDHTEKGEDHLLHDVKTVVVDPADIINALRDNQMGHTNSQMTRVLRLHPPFEEEMRAKPMANEESDYYPPEMNPKPIHLSPMVFVVGHDTEPGGVFDLHPPNLSLTEDRFRDEIDAWTDEGEARELTEEEKQKWNEWLESAVEVWEGRVRDQLVDEIRLSNRRGETTIQVRYEE